MINNPSYNDKAFIYKKIFFHDNQISNICTILLQPTTFTTEIRVDAPPPLSEAEFDDIMSRNRTVSSSAIARAVADASSGNLKKMIVYYIHKSFAYLVN